jgi:RND superfamily putative drug exporter
MTAPHRLNVGPVGRLGRWTAGHVRIVVAAWVVIAIGLGTLAPRAEKALSGAGWEATGSESVHARSLINTNFHGLGSYGLTVVVHAPDGTVSDPTFARVVAAVEARLKREPAVAAVAAPRGGGRPPGIQPCH